MEKNNYSEDFMDKILYASLCNLYTEAKETHTIKLNNFSFSNKGHLTLLRSAQMAHDVFGFQVRLCVSPLEFFFKNFKYKYRKFCKREKSSENAINSVLFISHIENANKAPDVFKTIYETYYERKKK